MYLLSPSDHCKQCIGSICFPISVAFMFWLVLEWYLHFFLLFLSQLVWADIDLRLRHTLLHRKFYSSGTLCIVNFCSKEQFASNWLVTVCSLTQFTPQHTLPTGIFFSLEHFAPQPPLLPRTLFSSAQFASQHTLLLSPLYSLAHFAPWNTLLPGIFWSKWLHLKW